MKPKRKIVSVGSILSIAVSVVLLEFLASAANAQVTVSHVLRPSSAPQDLLLSSGKHIYIRSQT
jgi:hypothetical protein